jgi:hypothetical protein
VRLRTAGNTVAVSEKRRQGERYGLVAVPGGGTVRSLWVRTRAGNLAEAMPRIRRELEQTENAVIESNSILRFLQPDIYLSVMDPAVEDLKDSALLYLDRADAVLVPDGVSVNPEWMVVWRKLMVGIRCCRCVRRST